MKKIFLLFAAVSFVTITYGQDIGLEANYTKKQKKHLSKFTPLSEGDVIVHLGFGNANGSGFGVLGNHGLLFTASGEYMFTDKMGIRLLYADNHLAGLSYWGGYSRATVDLSYHFIQHNRWDIYAFAGVGVDQVRYRIFNGTTNESYKFRNTTIKCWCRRSLSSYT